jgi:type IV pilus assembly protein PilO
MASPGLGRLPWYGQIAVFVLLSVAATAAFWNFYASPAQAAIAGQRSRLAAMHTEIARAQRTARNLPAFRQEVSGLEAQLDRLKAVLPEEQDVAELLRRVQGMATQSRLAIKGFTPKVVTKQQLHAEWPIGLQLEGTYHDLGAFLERVSKFPRIINVGNIKITSHDKAGSGSTITADCTATTFVLLDAEVEAALPDTKGAKKPKAPARKAE